MNLLKKRKYLILFGILLLAATVGAFLMSNSMTNVAKKTIYTCPMHPEIIQDEPGSCPICKMDLVPMEKAEDAPGSQPDTHAHRSASGVSGRSDRVIIDPVTVQNMGVRTAPVKRRKISRDIRLLGEVDVAETGLSVVNLRYSGWIEKIHVNETGSYVKKGQPLFRIYSPELVLAQEEFLNALKTGGPQSPLAKSARARLELAGAGAWLVNAVEKNQKTFKTVTVPSAQNGYVLHKNIVKGSKVKAGQDLYRIGNLTNIWINVEIYEFDAPYIDKNDSARMELSFIEGKTFEGKVDYVYPYLDTESRTLKARLVFPNPGLKLKPGMFATIWIEAEAEPEALAIPSMAILRTGLRQIVFLTKGEGKFEPREIITGLTGDKGITQVISGLNEGDIVVTSGQFLMDSESRIQEALSKFKSAGLADSSHAGHK